MPTISNLARRLAKLDTIVAKEQDAGNDALALSFISEAFCADMAAFLGEPVVARERTTDEQACVDKFARKYHANGAKAELLAYLEALPDDEEDDTSTPPR